MDYGQTNQEVPSVQVSPKPTVKFWQLFRRQRPVSRLPTPLRVAVAPTISCNQPSSATTSSGSSSVKISSEERFDSVTLCKNANLKTVPLKVALLVLGVRKV